MLKHLDVISLDVLTFLLSEIAKALDNSVINIKIVELNQLSISKRPDNNINEITIDSILDDNVYIIFRINVIALIFKTFFSIESIHVKGYFGNTKVQSEKFMSCNMFINLILIAIRLDTF